MKTRTPTPSADNFDIPSAVVGDAKNSKNHPLIETNPKPIAAPVSLSKSAANVCPG